MSSPEDDLQTPDPAPGDASRRRRPFYLNPWLWAFIAGAIAIPIIRPFFRREPKPPPVLSELPAYTLVDQHGKAAGSNTLRGNVYVTFFFFTHCKSICPKLMRAMVKLQKRYDRWKNRGVRLVGITVDPQNDRPPKLAKYLATHGGDNARFVLLTSTDGKDDVIRKVIIGGFKSHVGKRKLQGGVIDIAHSGKVLLVDRLGRLRGVYDTDDQGLDETFHRSLHVFLKER